MKTRKTYALLLLCATLLSSCNTTPEPATDDIDPVGDDATTVTETAETDYYAALDADLQYDGYEWNTLRYEAADWDIYLAPEEMTGESLNDAAVLRNQEVEELLNIVIRQTTDVSSEATFRNTVMAGEGETFDLLCFWSPGERSTFITEGLTYDWKSLPYVTLENPWYNQTANDAYSIHGKQYFAVSDLTFPVQQHFRILFNKERMTALSMDLPYDLVFAGKWTLDRLEEYCAGAYVDENGDGTADMGDSYGLGLNPAFGSIFPLNCGEIPVRSGADGFQLNLYSERITSIMERVMRWKDDQNYYFVSAGNGHYDLFNAGQLLFECFGSDPNRLRDIEFDFGYLPYPKYDETQENYVVWSAGGMMAVPSTASDPARSGAILEALSAASSKYIKDAFVEQYVLNKILRDKESQDIYRMMRDVATYDPSYNLDPSQLLANYAWYSYFLTENSTSFSSRYESTIGKIETAYQQLWDAAQ